MGSTIDSSADGGRYARAPTVPSVRTSPLVMADDVKEPHSATVAESAAGPGARMVMRSQGYAVHLFGYAHPTFVPISHIMSTKSI